jgi:hypothetical protein
VRSVWVFMTRKLSVSCAFFVRLRVETLNLFETPQLVTFSSRGFVLATPSRQPSNRAREPRGDTRALASRSLIFDAASQSFPL